MKKLFLVFVGFMLFSPTVFAQLAPLPGMEALIKEYLPKYSKILQPSLEKSMVKFATKTVEGKYVTEEQTAIDNAILELTEYGKVVLPEEEKQTTNDYKEITISVPEDYTINKYIDPDNEKEQLLFLTERSVLLNINDKETNFKLDYAIILNNEEEITDELEGYLYNALTLKIKYAPKYFTFKRVYRDYNPLKTVQVEYKGETITLNTTVYPVLTITTPRGYDMQYILEPNFQNIYNDFEFVRKGHKEAEIK